MQTHPINKRMLTLLLMQRLVLVVVLVRYCKNSSAMLFVAAVSQYALLPQGRIEATDA
jgi:hypothetical protein